MNNSRPLGEIDLVAGLKGKVQKLVELMVKEQVQVI